MDTRWGTAVVGSGGRGLWLTNAQSVPARLVERGPWQLRPCSRPRSRGK